jgi:hypothetical protein
MIDLASEKTFPLPQAAKYLPRGRKGRPVHFCTLLRWVVDGVKSLTGNRVHLEASRVGNKWVTSKEALQRFTERLTPAIGQDKPTPRTPGKRQRAADRAAEQLEKMGV